DALQGGEHQAEERIAARIERQVALCAQRAKARAGRRTLVETGELGVHHQPVAELLGEPALEIPDMAPDEGEGVGIGPRVVDERMGEEQPDGPALLLGEDGGSVVGILPEPAQAAPPRAKSRAAISLSTSKVNAGSTSRPADVSISARAPGAAGSSARRRRPSRLRPARRPSGAGGMASSWSRRERRRANSSGDKGGRPASASGPRPAKRLSAAACASHSRRWRSARSCFTREWSTICEVRPVKWPRPVLRSAGAIGTGGASHQLVPGRTRSGSSSRPPKWRAPNSPKRD